MNVEVYETRERVLADNQAAAAENRRCLREQGAFLINLMGSPGAGKTTLLLALLQRLGKSYRIGVMEADVDSDVDARAVAAAGARVVQLHTGGLCHMDADMTARGLTRLDPEGLDLIVLENIGNLVCPAEFEVGADLRLMLLSVPEGDDKPLKYPLMFQISDALAVTKLDTLPIFDFDGEALKRRVRELNPEMRIFPLSAKSGEGVDALAAFIEARMKEARER